MNELIQKLYKQASYQVIDDQLAGKPLNECRSIPEVFAELIVQECAQVASDFVPGYGLVPFSKRFNEHFGVE